MLLFRNVTIFTIIAALTVPAVAATPATAPAAEARVSTRPAPAIPPDQLRQLESLFKQREGDKGLARADLLKAHSQRMAEALRRGKMLEKEYPDSPDLHGVRMQMLQAANFLAMFRDNAASRKRLSAVVKRILSSSAPMDQKLQADRVMLYMNISKPDPSAPADPGRTIRDFVKRYEKTPVAPEATVNAHQFALRIVDMELASDLRKRLTGRFRKDPQVAEYLKQLARSHVGKPFTTSRLVRLDGTRLKLPDDLRGKVVVIDFWATWCRPCLEAMPEMKRLYAKYKDKGMEIVGISLDTKRSSLEAYVRKQKLGWIHTFTGKGWKDPTARKYGVGAIPSVWVVGRDGRVVSDQAKGRLDYVIARSLKMPRSGPPAPAAEKK